MCVDISQISDRLLADLTQPQRDAVTHVDGPLLVLAGPGSGKTRVVTRRVAYLMRVVGIPPWNILAITFTNKAAKEMKDRVAAEVSDRQSRAAMVCTFHSFCAKTLRSYANRVGLPPAFSIYDASDQQRAMKKALEELEISATNFPPAQVLSTISNAKNQLLDADAFALDAKDHYRKTVARLYKKYQQILRQSQALDFDDLLTEVVGLFRRHADVLAELRQRYQYVLIDEYQDTNHAQFCIARAIAGTGEGGGQGSQNICATGDPDQSIYGWRGADISNIIEFEDHFPSAKVVYLEQNYRSTKTILMAADRLIKNNRRRKHKTLWTDNEDGKPVCVAACHDEHHEAQWVVSQLRAMHKEHKTPWGHMAVFYRVNNLSRVIEEKLRYANVPYQVARGTAFYDRKEVRDAVGYLRIIVNPADEVNLLRVANMPPRGISETTVKAAQRAATALSCSLASALTSPQTLNAIPQRAANSVRAFMAKLAQWRGEAGFDSPNTPPIGDNALRVFVEHILRDSGLQAYYREDKGDSDVDRAANIGELVSSAQQFEQNFLAETTADGSDAPSLRERLEAFMEQISLVSDVDGAKNNQGTVTLMTLHAAKGLEFPVVAIVGVEESILPHARVMAQPAGNEMEEERRLCFVGITRARQHLMLTHTHMRTTYGRVAGAMPSRFLDELAGEGVKQIRAASSDDDPDETEIKHEHARESDRLAEEYPVGSWVRHQSFGLGRILACAGTPDGPKVKVAFTIGGVKTLMLKYTRLQAVDKRP